MRARDQLLNKFYAVALVDADTPTPGGGIELLQFARDKSPLTSVVIMTARKSYETAVKAFRAGAADVVLKEPDVVPYLRERVVEAATDIKATADRNSLLEEVAETHEEFLRRLRDVAREGAGPGRSPLRADGGGGRRARHRERRAGRRRSEGAREAGEGADRGGGLAVPRRALTGGEALDVVSQERPQIVMVKEDLPDLPGSMVVHTVKSSAPDAVTLLYTPPGPQRAARRGEAGRLERHDEHDRELRGAEPARRAAGRDPRGAARQGARSGATCRRSASATSSSCSATTTSSSASRKSSTAARRRPAASRGLAKRGFVMVGGGCRYGPQRTSGVAGAKSQALRFRSS